MTLNESVIEVVNNLQRDGASADTWVNGNDTATYQATGGEFVPSIQKLVKDFEDRTEYTGEYAGGGTVYTRGQTFNEAYAAYVVTSDFISTDFASDAANYKVAFDLNTIVQAALDAQTAAAASAVAAGLSEDAAAASAVAAGLSEVAAQTAEANAVLAQGYSEIWATHPEDTLIPAAAGGNEADDYSALHHAAKASDSATDAADSAAAAAAVPAPQLNPKAFAGGVAYTGIGHAPINNSGTWDLSSPFMVVTTVSNDLTASGSNRFVLTNGFAAGSIAIYVPNGFDQIQAWVRGASVLRALVSSTVLGEVATIALEVIPEDTANLYVNGVLADTIGISGIDPSEWDTGTDWVIGANSSGNNGTDGTSRGTHFFNTALTATQHQEIYTLGVRPWLAANPAYQWGSPTPEYESDFSAGVDGWATTNGTAVGNVDSIGGEDDTLEFTVNTVSTTHSVKRSVSPIAGDRVNIKARLYVPSTNTVADGIRITDNSGFIGTNYSVTPDTWIDIDIEYTASVAVGFIVFNAADGSSTIVYDPTGTDKFYLKDVSVQVVGCLASLPMDEGIGYQLHDDSPNHFDALLSETGTSHLIPKREGFVRDFNVDAFAGPVDIITGAQDIVTTDMVETSYLSDAIGNLTSVRTGNNITVQSDNAADTAIKLRRNLEKID